MSCHEIAALRLGLMNLLGLDDEAERQHEWAELGPAGQAPGPLRALTEARDLGALRRAFESALVALSERVARMAPDAPALPYHRSLLVLTRKVELELASLAETWTRHYRDLEELHDFVHELYPRPE